MGLPKFSYSVCVYIYIIHSTLYIKEEEVKSLSRV